MNSWFTHTVCLECGHQMPPDIHLSACAACGSQWLDARYDYESVARLWPGVIKGRDRSLWRYLELLPLGEPDPEITMGEGFTSLTRLYQYEALYQHEYLFAKDERQGPTSSFKDRQAALSVMAMRRAGITECVLASTGNAGAAYAAYCARAGIKLWLFLTSQVPSEKMREAALYGAEVVKVSGTYDETKHVAAEFAKRKGIHLDRGAKAIPGKESMKSLAYEMAEQMAAKLGPDSTGKWRAPDWYIQAVSGGIGPLGVWKGFQELYQMGLIDHLPKLGIIQAAGCAPMVEAFHSGADKATPVVPKTLITVLATGDPGPAYGLLREACLTTGGTMLAIDDGITFEAMRRLASKEGFSVEPATAVAFAGMESMLTDGMIAPHESVIVNCSGHTFTAESHILGDQYVLDLQIQNGEKRTTTLHPAVHEGLDAAIRKLDEQVTTILIVDDNPTDRRLIKRLLQRYKRYRIEEATNGADALHVIRDRQPDCIITDLTMPELDGFGFLELLKMDPSTAAIPVVVISAKTITAEDNRFLGQLAESVWMKGGFDTRVLVDHVVTMLGHSLEVEEAAEPRADRPARRPDTGSLPHEQRISIVAIEDSPEDLRLTRKVLESAGLYNVYTALNARDGLKAVYEHKPDLILLDLMLPDMDGFSVLDTLQNDHRLREIPVVVLSGKELSKVEAQRLAEQATLLLPKARFNNEQFLEQVKIILG
jgi:threonine synthase